MVTIESLLHNVDTAVSEEHAQQHDKELGKIASQFFDSLIRQYDPLVASATASEQNNQQAAQMSGADGKIK